MQASFQGPPGQARTASFATSSTALLVHKDTMLQCHDEQAHTLTWTQSWASSYSLSRALRAAEILLADIAALTATRALFTDSMASSCGEGMSEWVIEWVSE